MLKCRPAEKDETGRRVFRRSQCGATGQLQEKNRESGGSASRECSTVEVATMKFSQMGFEANRSNGRRFPAPSSPLIEMLAFWGTKPLQLGPGGRRAAA